MNENKICPMLSKVVDNVNRYGGKMFGLHEEYCRGKYCAWWDEHNEQCSVKSIAEIGTLKTWEGNKFFEEKPEPKIEKIDLNDAFNAIGTELLKMYNNEEIPDKKYNQACNYVDWLSYMINEGVDLDEC